MSILTEKQIQYGFDYYHADEPEPRCVIEVSEYRGESSLTIACTQLGDNFTPQYKTQKEKKRVLQEWCEFLRDNSEAFEALSFCTRVPQTLFNAVCQQKRLKKLHLKWGVYPDLTQLSYLQNLEYLHIGSGAGVQSIAPIALLSGLIALSVENFQKIRDYSALAELKCLESLCIEGDGLGPQYIHVDSLNFLKEMPQLRYFSFMTARLASKDMTPVLSLVNAEHLTLRSGKETKLLYDRIIALPKLKYGLLVERPKLYR